MIGRKNASILLGALAVSAGLVCLFSSSANAASTYTLKDYSALGDIPSEYSHSKVYFTANTKIYVKDANSSSYGSTPITPSMIKNATGGYVYDSWNTTDPSKSVKIKVTGSTATDNSGNPVDVVYTIKNLVPAPDTSTCTDESIVSLSLSRGAPGIKTEDGTIVDDYSDGKFVKVGDPGTPVIIGARAICAEGQFFVQFYKAGTEQLATLSKIAVLSYDYDAKGYSGVDENTTPLPLGDANTTYYYDKSSDGELTVSGTNGMVAYNGEDRNPDHLGGDLNALYYKDSVLALVDYGNTTGGQYGFSYSARNAHIEMLFGAVNQSSVNEEAPVKHVVELNQKTNRATGGDTYKYIITHKIPDLFRPDLNIFNSLHNKYSNVAQDYSYNLYSISDKLSSEHFDLSKGVTAKVYLDNEDVTDKFRVALDDDGLLFIYIDAMDSNLIKTANFYNKTIRVEFDVTVSPTIAVGEIVNTADAAASRNNGSRYRKSTNEVTTSIYHTLTVRHINKDNGQELTETVTTEHDHGYEYTTTKLEELPGKLRLIETPENANGTLVTNTVVTYYYSAVENPKTFDLGLIPFAAAFVGAGGIGGAIFFVVSKRR